MTARPKTRPKSTYIPSLSPTHSQKSYDMWNFLLVGIVFSGLACWILSIISDVRGSANFPQVTGQVEELYSNHYERSHNTRHRSSSNTLFITYESVKVSFKWKGKNYSCRDEGYTLSLRDYLKAKQSGSTRVYVRESDPSRSLLSAGVSGGIYAVCALTGIFGALMLIIAYLCSRDGFWQRCRKLASHQSQNK